MQKVAWAGGQKCGVMWGYGPGACCNPGCVVPVGVLGCVCVWPVPGSNVGLAVRKGEVALAWLGLQSLQNGVVAMGCGLPWGRHGPQCGTAGRNGRVHACVGSPTGSAWKQCAKRGACNAGAGKHVPILCRQWGKWGLQVGSVPPAAWWAVKCMGLCLGPHKEGPRVVAGSRVTRTMNSIEPAGVCCQRRTNQCGGNGNLQNVVCFKSGNPQMAGSMCRGKPCMGEKVGSLSMQSRSACLPGGGGGGGVETGAVPGVPAARLP